MFNSELHYLLEAAFKEATTRKHLYFCVEHILYALLFDPECAKIIKQSGGSVEKLKNKLVEYFDTQVEKDNSNNYQEDPSQTPSIRRVIQRAMMQVKSSGKDLVTPKDVLIAIINEEDSHASFFIAEQGIKKIDILNFVSHGVSKSDSDEDFYERVADSDEDDGTDESSENLLQKFTEDITDLARKGKLDPIVGRDSEISRAIRILSRRQKNNPLFIGDPGVGKTSLVNGIALKIIAGEVPDVLKNTSIYSLHVGSLVAGTKFRGEFEARLKGIVKQLKENSILFIDEIHQIVGAGATGSGSMDAANLLKPALQGGLRCIGSTTFEDYKKSFEKDRALSRRFSTIEVKEPSISETIEILKGLVGKYQDYHKVQYTSVALKAAAELSAKHITSRLLPDKAIDVIDEAGAANAVLPTSKRKKSLTDKDIEVIVSLMAKVPVQSVSKDDAQTLLHLEDKLKSQVFGQDQAVKSIVQAVKRSRSMLSDDRKPIGCFLFAGPTGVGKTELSKVLAKELGVAFHRFDMSEYMEKHAVARLIGAPPGYVGYEEGGQLTDLVRRTPYAVLLLDEIEKAHPDIYNILLQVMDDARLTDSHGKEAEFKNIILIMTTNAGSDKSAVVGFGSGNNHSNQDEAIKKLFKPEFRNRLDEIIYFNPLPNQILRSIVDKNFQEIENQLSTRKVKLELSDQARDFLAQKGFDPILGARPMRRLIQKEVKDALAEELLFGKLKKGGTVKVTLNGDKLEFKVNPLE
jgi:ATP-dependent Clp protease ATP-binding subunit ClpA